MAHGIEEVNRADSWRLEIIASKFFLSTARQLARASMHSRVGTEKCQSALASPQGMRRRRNSNSGVEIKSRAAPVVEIVAEDIIIHGALCGDKLSCSSARGILRNAAVWHARCSAARARLARGGRRRPHRGAPAVAFTAKMAGARASCCRYQIASRIMGAK